MASRTKRAKIETLGGQAFNVPNDEEGRTFLRSMRKFINRPLWRFTARGRGPRLRPGDTHVSFSRSLGIPQHESKWIAVYLGGTGQPWGGFRACLSPNARTTTYSVNANIPPYVPPGPKFTPQEQSLLEKLLEKAEAEMEFADDEAQETFYSIFQKLVDI